MIGLAVDTARDPQGARLALMHIASAIWDDLAAHYDEPWVLESLRGCRCIEDLGNMANGRLHPDAVIEMAWRLHVAPSAIAALHRVGELAMEDSRVTLSHKGF
jgi:hypothetical protein